MIYSDFPITLITASILGIIYSTLCFIVIRTRFKTQIAVGHENKKLMRSYRAQSNFIEYVPLMLILLGLLENANVHTGYLLILSIVFITARILHPIGFLSGNSVNAFHTAGASLTLILLFTMSTHGLYIFLLD